MATWGLLHNVDWLAVNQYKSPNLTHLIYIKSSLPVLDPTTANECKLVTHSFFFLLFPELLSHRDHFEWSWAVCSTSAQLIPSECEEISGVHRLFEAQGRKEGHFSTRFGSIESNLVRVLATKRAVYHVLTSQGGSLTHFFGS